MESNSNGEAEGGQTEQPKGVPEATLVNKLGAPCLAIYIYLNYMHIFFILLSLIQRFLEMEEQRMKAPMPKVEIDSLSTRSYLDRTVVPILLDAMAEVARRRYIYLIN